MRKVQEGCRERIRTRSRWRPRFAERRSVEGSPDCALAGMGMCTRAWEQVAQEEEKNGSTKLSSILTVQNSKLHIEI